MALKTMYPPQKDSPTTFLLGDISATDTLMTVASAAALPQVLPYPLTLGMDKTLTETVMVTAQNLENNQLTITRGTPAYAWVAGSKAARVLRATDFLDVQDNLRDVDTRLTTTQGTVSTHGTDISTLKTTVGGPTSGLVKGLADEIVRATAAEGAESTRATAAESNLNTIKINRSELAQVITDWSYSADETKVQVTITRYNASTQQTTQYARTLPIVSDEAMGVMTPEAYAEITALRNDVNSLINLGGRFIGVSFATKAVLNEYSVPASVKTKDFTYVLDDETKSGATTRYVWNGSTWEFTFVIEHDPVGLATSSTPGLVKSDSGSTDGKVFVEIDGTMSVIGWNSVFNADNHVSGTTNKVFTATEQTKLDGIAAGAEKNVNADFNATSGDAQILNLPSTFPPSVHGHAIADVTGLAASLAQKAPDSHTHDARYYTESEMNTKLSGKSDTSHDHTGQVIQPTSIELLPGTSAGHGGYIDFHFNSDAADYTSRIYEPVKGVLKYNNFGLLSTANITAVWNVNVTFTNGIAEYSNSAIKANRPCFAQFRAGSVDSTFQDTALSVSNPTNGKLNIVAKNGATFSSNLNILILNL